MKSIFLLITFLLLTSWGCSENNPLSEPVNQTNLSVAQSITAEPNWIKLPAPKYQSLNKIFKKTKLIKANKDCYMGIEKDYDDADGNRIRVEVNMKFLAGTLNEDTEITMKVNSKTGVLTFSPHMEFNKNAKLTFLVIAPQFKGIEAEDVSFRYLAPDGSYEYVDVKRIVVDSKKGKLKVVKAKVPHFSRYGFVH